MTTNFCIISFPRSHRLSKMTSKLAFTLSSLLLLTTFSVATTAYEIPEVTDFFPELQLDRSKVVWAHAVNSEEKLELALEGSAMMIEADVLMGTVPAVGWTDNVPIMAHPPDSTSNLTFDTFLDTILKVNNDFHKRKGIKLDFKDISSVEAVLKRLNREAEAERLNFPVWLNADVLKGPIAATQEPINGLEFIGLAKKYLPTATLSLGWTTRFGRDQFRLAEQLGETVPNLKTIRAKSGYTQQNVQEMVDLVRKSGWEGPVTFAGLITPKESLRQLGRLTVETLLDSATFTVWSVVDDPVNMDALRPWVLIIQKDLVYLDLPFDLSVGPVLIPDPEPVRPLARSDHLFSVSSRNVAHTFILFVNMALLIFARVSRV